MKKIIASTIIASSILAFLYWEARKPHPLWVGMRATLREKQQLFSDHVGIWWCFL